MGGRGAMSATGRGVGGGSDDLAEANDFELRASTELSGTPNQVSWANDIREKMLSGLAEYIKQVNEVNLANGDRAADVEAIQSMVDGITNARFYIQNRRILSERGGEAAMDFLLMRLSPDGTAGGIRRFRESLGLIKLSFPF